MTNQIFKKKLFVYMSKKIIYYVDFELRHIFLPIATIPLQIKSENIPKSDRIWLRSVTISYLLCFRLQGHCGKLNNLWNCQNCYSCQNRTWNTKVAKFFAKWTWRESRKKLCRLCVIRTRKDAPSICSRDLRGLTDHNPL